MKTAVLLCMLSALAISNISSDDLGHSPTSIATVVASMPTRVEIQKWGSISLVKRKSYPDYKSVEQKFQNEEENCHLLESLVVVGKPISDYPGLLAIGIISWIESTQCYDLWVKLPSVEGGYGGFRCQFDKSMTITAKRTVNYDF